MTDPIVAFDEEAVRDELKELARKAVEDTLNAPLEVEADDLSSRQIATRGSPSARPTAPVITNAASPPPRAR